MSAETAIQSRWVGASVISATVCLLACLGYWLWPAPDKEIPPIPPNPIPQVVTTGELKIVPDGEIAIQLLADEAVFITNMKTGQTSTVFNGVNLLEPGTYSLAFEGPEDFKSLDDIQVVQGDKRTRRLTTSLLRPFAFPTIPEKVGAFAVYEGTVWLQGWPETKNVSFQIRLHVLSLEEQEGSPKFAWLKVETTTQHALGEYNETGYLKVNLDRWKSDSFLDVAEGYVRASGKTISSLALDGVVGANETSLVVPFSKEHDWLLEVASHVLPEHRLSLHDFLALFFGDRSIRAATETIREFRPRLLSAGDRNAWIESFQDSFGGRVPCYVASSRSRETDRKTMGYLMAKTKREPFSFVRMEATMPFLKAVCAITRSGTAKVDKNELVLAEKDCIDPTKWAPKNQFWSVVGLPDKMGETTWHGELKTADSPRQFVQVTARMLDKESVNDREYHWIEIEVSGTLDQGQNEHWESARLLVDDLEYRDFGRFQAKTGWLSFGDAQTVFSLPENSDLTEIFNQRLMLFETPNFGRFGVMDALALLFDANKFNPQSPICILRKEIAVACIGSSPQRTLVPFIPYPSAPEVLGELWEYPATAPVKYKIKRSPHILFDLVDLSLERKPLDLNISLAIKSTTGRPNNPIPQTTIPLAVLGERQKETQLRVEESIKPNWRIWTWNHSGTRYRAWAEFGGTMGTGKPHDRLIREVLLRGRNGQEIRVPCSALIDDDWNWARLGRLWKSNGLEVNSQYNLVGDLSNIITLQRIDGEKYQRDFESLTDEEQSWVIAYRSAKKQKPNSNEQILEWQDFAADIGPNPESENEP